LGFLGGDFQKFGFNHWVPNSKPTQANIEIQPTIASATPRIIMRIVSAMANGECC
jgi:hypothetical protein